MVRVFGAGTAKHFNPKDFGMNTGLSRLFSDIPVMEFRGCLLTV